MHQLQARPQLRAKTGCLTCRRRKKKCDENKPHCGDCAQFKRTCTWPTVLTDHRNGRRVRAALKESLSSIYVSPSAAPTPGASTTIEDSKSLALRTSVGSEIHGAGRTYDPQNQINWYHPTTASSRERMLFHHFANHIMSRAIQAHAHPVYGEYKDAYQLGFQMPDIMNVYLGIAALHIARDDKKASLVATRLYTPSINAVWRRIKDGEVDGTEEWLFVSTVFMILFEFSRFDLHCDIMIHLEGLAQLFTVRKAKVALPDPQKPFHRIAAEAFTYHIATSSILNRQIDLIATQFTWEDLNPYSELNLIPEASESANSPILGPHVGLYQIIFDITRLSRHTPLNSIRYQQGVEYSGKLDLIQYNLAQCLNLMVEAGDQELREGALLYTLVSQLFMFKILNPKVNSLNCTIRQLVSRSILLLRRCKPSTYCTSYYCWPLTILACAVTNDKEKSLIKDKLAEIWQDSRCGQVYRTTKVINALWDNRTDSGNGTGLCCNLDKLLHRSGLVDSLKSSRFVRI